MSLAVQGRAIPSGTQYPNENPKFHLTRRRIFLHYLNN